MNSQVKKVMMEEFPNIELRKYVCKKDPFGKYLKIYNDGKHFVGYGETSKFRRHYSFRFKTNLDELMDKIFLQAMKQNLKGPSLREFVKKGIIEESGYFDNIDVYIDKRIKSKIHNIHVRLKRFRRKLYLNKWNYFTTFTFDNAKMNADIFREKLKKCLSNLHTRHNWRYMGVFELSPEENRLHFHAIMYIPKGEMVGEIFEERSYSTKKKAMQITHINTFFQKKFGRCDFNAITEQELRFGNTANYLIKYLSKTGEKILYSRGIPTGIYKYIFNEDIASEYTDYVIKYVLFDDVLDSEDIYNMLHPPTIKQLCIFA